MVSFFAVALYFLTGCVFPGLDNYKKSVFLQALPSLPAGVNVEDMLVAALYTLNRQRFPGCDQVDITRK